MPNILRELILKNRSYRRFYETDHVELETLEKLVDLARNSASAANLQPLKYVLSNNAQDNALIFPHLSWAAYLKEWPGPGEGERPAAYIIIVGDKRISNSFGCDHGIAAQSIMLGATEKGLGGCIIGAIRRQDLQHALSLPQYYEILLALAIGRPRETVVLETVRPDNDIRYWRDDNDAHHVPKRRLDDIIIPTSKQEADNVCKRLKKFAGISGYGFMSEILA
ncbi:conserved hypothetical protein [uncultured Desulfobacterium sp.]|uniref:Nitroreductase domain-containing protein n=1 Tax=uncultured Desulfobacterium sp. TaxID=201089 RepID=A0A445MXC0_9BACT|nr:conserved hypothetical protein [uncultured Desulfobacterium sp.]